VTVLFSDVRNFTALCEGRGPEEILSLLNLYLTQVSNLIEDNGGVVDKYIGDAVMALFGAPLEMGNDAANAVETGMGMRRILVDLNRGFAEQGLPQIGIGIGINTGLVVAGNMGSERRLNYTVIGDGVNLAARLEGLTKKYGLEIIVSESTRRAAPGYVYRKLDRVRVKGKKDAVGIYEPLGESDALDAAERRDLEIFDGAMRDLRLRHWDPARSALSRLRHGDADGRYAKLYGVYLERLEHYVAEPPDSEWDGTVEFSEK